MLGVARVLMILSGICGLPSVACSGMCSNLMADTQAPPGGEMFYRLLFYASLLASVGAIFVGAKAKKLGKAKTAVSCLVFAGCYAGLVLQLNLFGLGSAGLLILAAIMTLVAEDKEFRATDE